MATKKKGCGFLITALILLLIGGGIATYLGQGAASSGIDFVSGIREGEAFTTPSPLTYTAEETNEVTVWMENNGGTASPGNIGIEYLEHGGSSAIAERANGSNSIENQLLVASFPVEEGKTYTVKALDAPDGLTFRVAKASPTDAISMVGKGLGAIGAIGIFGVIALIFGIIGLVRFFSSTNQHPSA